MSRLVPHLSQRWIPKVSAQERQELEALARSQNRAEADRARAMLLTLLGQTSPQIAGRLQACPEQVRHWRSLFGRGGTEALRVRRRPGRPPRKAEAALAVAEQVLGEPRSHEPPWTCPRLAQEIHKRTGISISPAHLSRVLRSKKGAGAESAPVTLSGQDRMPMKSPAAG